VRDELVAIDHAARFTPSGLRAFHHLLARLGVATTRPIGLPVNDTPFWHRAPHPFANYQSDRKLPAHADVVVIGAGLTGAAAAYYLRHSGRRVIVLDRGDPAGEASGRNGGNFELIPENSVGIYEGLARERLLFMRRRYPQVPIEVLEAVSERQASLVLGLALRNRNALKEIVLREGIACDFSPRGWLHIAASERDEQGICEEVSLAAQHQQRIEIWSRGKIRQEFGFDSTYLGRFIPGDGTYHPFKYVCGLLQCALAGGVGLFTRVKVRQIRPTSGAWHRLETDRGVITAGAVIVATDAFTRELLPELSRITLRQSQIMVTEHVKDRARGRIVTSDAGPLFFNQPREGASHGCAPLLMGGGEDRPMKNPSSRRRSPAVHAHLLRLRDHFYPDLKGQPPSSEWIGPMAFTPDGLPCIGFLRPGLIVAAGYNGYGGSYTTAAGMAAAEMAISGAVPGWVPEDTFSPQRLLNDEPLFLSNREGLWQVAESLCEQLRAVNRKISDALTLQGVEPLQTRPQMEICGLPGRSRSAQGSDARSLRSLPAFRKFSLAEIRALLRLMRRWDVPKGTIIFTEGSSGKTCFVVLQGSVDISIDAHGRQQLLATLPAGNIFGQVSLIANMPRSATCSARSDTVLLELERSGCEALLRSGSPTALKLLATLNDGLVTALRGADLRLMKLDQEFGAGTVSMNA
jgi:glycine/D-amino acid oxidase-like deaminating enzyme